MTHLSTDERLALIEAPGEPRHPHLAACERCRQEVTAGRAALEDARATDVPEPSPLFWNHFSARLSALIDEEPSRVRGRVRAPWRILVPFAAAVALLVMAVAVGRGPSGSQPTRPSTAAAIADAPTAVEDPTANDEGWDMLGRLAGDFDVETLGDSLGRSPLAGAESAVWQLNEGERAELTRLLQAEMRSARSGS
jgi:hypothetical protein